MKFDITRQQPFASLVILLITSIIGFFVILNGSHAVVVFAGGESILGGYVREFQQNYRVWSAILSTVIILISSAWLGQVISIHNLYGASTSLHLSLLGVTMWSSVLGSESLLSSLIVALMVAAIGSLFIASRGNKYIGSLFDASFALSLLPLLYSPSTLLWVTMPLILIFVGATIREWIVAMAGLLLPFCAVSYIYWLIGFDFLFVGESLISLINTPSGATSIDTIPIFRTLVILISLALASISILWFGLALPRARARFNIMYVLFVASLLTLASPSATIHSFVLVSPLLATLLTYTLVKMRGFVANTIYPLMILLLLLAMLIPTYLPLEQLISLLR